MKWECKKCGKFISVKYRISKKYCSACCKELDKQKICKYCNKEFKANILSQRLCNECKLDKNKVSRIKYKNALTKKICKNCNCEFFNTYHTLLCKKCKLDLPNPLIHNYEWMFRPIICNTCKLEIGKNKVKNSYRAKPILYIKKCELCKQNDNLTLDLKILDKVIKSEKRKCIQRENKKRKYNELILKLEKKRIQNEIRENLKKEHDKLKQESRNSKIKNKITDEELLKKIRLQNKKNLVNRMKTNNPMKRKDVVDKVRNTIKRKIQNGELIYKKGSAHPAYKGIRDFSGDCRKWLSGWKRQVLERDKFSCVGCGIKNTQFHIHHIRPLRNIIQKVLTEMKINDIVSVKNSDIVLYEQSIQNVVNDHTLADGITVCKQCHANIDYRYRRVKKNIIN